MLPPDYVTAHVELAYASTAHGVQGDTVPSPHLVIGEHTGAAAAYVGMTRGRTGNTAHLFAADEAEAREQWIAVFARDRADLGPASAAQRAAEEAARYAQGRPLMEVLADLHTAWTAEQRCQDRLTFLERQRDSLRRVVALEAAHAGELVRRDADYQATAIAAQRIMQQAESSATVIAAYADRTRDALLARWDGERDAASAAAKVVLDGPGRLGLRRAAVARAVDQLTDWADQWRPHVPSLPEMRHQLARVARACLLTADAVMDDHAAEEDTAEVGGGVFVVAGGDSAPLLEPAEPAFDGVAVLVELGIAGRWSPTGRALGLAACDLVAAFGNRVSDLLRPQVRPRTGMGVRLVRQQPERA
ncbi:hypothetical protein SAMN05661080_04996, partial [Modestobacter sp. DSM 44400]